MTIPGLKSGALIALAAGSLFAAACKKDDSKDSDRAGAGMKAGEKMAKVHCMGVNECKGHGGCKSELNACAGQNGCKGQSFVEMTEPECKAAGGELGAK